LNNPLATATWDKKIHVESSLPAKDGQYAMFVGRWQPLHKGHQSLFQEALDEGKNVLICDIQYSLVNLEVIANFAKKLYIIDDHPRNSNERKNNVLRYTKYIKKISNKNTSELVAKKIESFF